MIKHKQLNLHDPDNGVFGDCQRTVFACLMDLAHPEMVPNFGEHYGNRPAWEKSVKEWVASQGYAYVEFAFAAELEQLFTVMKANNTDVFYTLAGESRSGVNHVVIGLNDGIYWDTSLNSSGIIGPCDDGYYWIGFLVPLSMTNTSRN